MKSFASIKADIAAGKKVHYKQAVELPAVKFRLILRYMQKATYRWDPLSMTWAKKNVEVKRPI